MRRAGFIFFPLLGIMVLAVLAATTRQTGLAANGCREGGSGCDSAESATPLRIPVQLQAVDAMTEVPIADNTCASATELILPVGTLISGVTDVTSGFSTSAIDPDLSACMDGTTSNEQGYRTAWYRFLAPTSGRLVVEAAPNSNFLDDYDTVIALFDGTDECGSLTRLVCNDDSNSILSRISYDVIQGRTYYIEIADRNLSVNGEARLNLQVLIEAESRWAMDSALNMPTPRSRHVALPVGDKIYVIGGETQIADYPFEDNPDPAVRTAVTAVFDAANRVWDESLAPMPPSCDFNGYSGVAGVAVSGKIHLPTGFVGDHQNYADTHCIYDIANDSWSIGPSVPWVGGSAVAYHTLTHDPVTNGFYLAGGVRGPWFGHPLVTTASDEFYFYTNGTWIARPSMGTARYSHTAAYVTVPNTNTRLICVVGGLTPFDDPNLPAAIIPDGECYDLATNTWSATDRLNVLRFNAGSFVGPDGVWYVVGGVAGEGDGSLLPVAEIEAFDPISRTWTVVDHRYDLNMPAYSWPRGGFVGDNLWIVGGETIRFNDVTGEFDVEAIAEVRSADFRPLFHRPFETILPIVGKLRENNETNDTFFSSLPLLFDQSVRGNFDTPFNDRFDVYHFRVTESRLVTLELTRIPTGHDYALMLYNDNKLLLALSDEVNNIFERIVINLDPGLYYVIVVGKDQQPLHLGDYRLELR